MSRIFFGKISNDFPQQLEENYYAGGKKGSPWYGGIEVGDYVFPVHDSFVTKLWRVKEYSSDPNSINEEGSVKFELIKVYQEPISVAFGFTRYKNFKLNLNLLNKVIKSTAMAQTGFYEIDTEDACPEADRIDFSETRNIYIALASSINTVDYKEGDIRVLIESKSVLRIQDIQIYQRGMFQSYAVLLKLYNEKNLPQKRYTLSELLEYAISDVATKKAKYLSAVIQAINENGYYLTTNPIGLYDNILVGRRVTPKRKKVVNGGRGKEPEIIGGDDEPTMEDISDYKEHVELLSFSPNLILYGPPGTGKTYAAQRIVEAFEFNRTKQSRSYQEIQHEGRVTMVTFHQSFSYEEFIEGLRPVLTETEEQVDFKGELKYRVQPGVLLTMADNAARSQIGSEFNDKDFGKVKESNRIWKISLGQRGKDDWVYDSCIKTNTIAIGWFDEIDIASWDYNTILKNLVSAKEPGGPTPTNDANSINNFVNELQIGDLVLVFDSQTSIRAIGMVDGNYEWKKEYPQGFRHRRKAKWLKKFEESVDIRKFNGGKRLSQVTLYELSNMKFLDIKSLLEEGDNDNNDEKAKLQSYFLIIDEINRGNIAKIFGELITLIEKDKRDKIKIRLPYSQKEFSLPSNLYIIGTMNSSDKGISLVDIALRRRFVFKEVEPSARIVKAKNQFVENDLDLSILMDAINKNISEKIGRDFRLGHSYFLDINSMNDLRIVWYYQIMPLLMEYYHHDAVQIAKIISEVFIDKDNGQVKIIASNPQFKLALKNIK